MIYDYSGDIFDSPDTQCLVNPVNCVGVMGAGLAKQFKEKFPVNYTVYKEACNHHTLHPGGILFTVTDTPNGRLWIANFATKDHWKNDSRLDWIAAGLGDLKAAIIEQKIESVSIPALGCGLGGLDWKDVRLLIELNFYNIKNCDVVVYGPT